MNPCALTKPTVSLVSVTGSKVDIFFRGRKVRVFVSGKEVKDLPKNLQKIQSAIQLRLFMKNAYVLTQETKDGPFLHVHQKGVGGATYSITIDGVVINGNTPDEFLHALTPQLQRLGAHEQVIQRLFERVNDQDLQVAEFQNQINLLVLQLQHTQDETWITLYQERLREGNFFNAAVYFAKISPANRKNLLTALIEGKDSKIFQLGFHLVSNSEIMEGSVIVKAEFPRQVADIILNHSTKLFYFSLPSSDPSQADWEMAVGKYPPDRRNENSHWVMAIHPDGVKGRGSWKLVPQDNGRFFHIRFPVENTPEENWHFLCSHRDVGYRDVRGPSSSWLLTHSPGYAGKNWELRYLPDGTFYIALEEDFAGQRGWVISAHRYDDKDRRNELSTWMMAVAPEYGNTLAITMR